MGSHQSAAMISDTWLTPPEIIRALGSFDLDPCCPPVMPWPTAARMLNERDDGLSSKWEGRVWLNPPYSREAVKWLRKLAQHGHGTALVFARTETAWFFETVWRAASSVLFLEGRIYFHRADGTRAAANAGAPSCLVAYGAQDAVTLSKSGIAGHYVEIAHTSARSMNGSE
ncbi:MAG TPA: DNA N-6-adenine-methyltransferase [Dongiaceae bacterium]|nr:DNA N-6-adenine-methyltransferase [Dongiaceae bacterium]